MVERLSPFFNAFARRRISGLVPTIVQSQPGKFPDILELLRQHNVLQALRAQVGGPGLVDLIRRDGGVLGLGLMGGLREAAIAAFQEIRAFNMVGLPLTLNIIEDLAQESNVRTLFRDGVMNILGETVPPDGVFINPNTKKKFTTTAFTRQVVGADAANAEGWMGDGVTVAVIDSGARPEHPQLAGRVTVMTVPPFTGIDNNGHSVWCQTCIGGGLFNDPVLQVPLLGMAPRVRIVSVMALGFVVGTGSSSGIIKAMEKSIQAGADVVSMSLGSNDCPPSDSNPEAVAVVEMAAKGVIPVIAAGNAGPNPDTLGSPGCVDQALTVAALDPINGGVADFSSRGGAGSNPDKPDVAAPGVQIDSGSDGLLDAMTDRRPSRTATLSGTSMATPHVAGMVALARQAMKAAQGKTLTVEMVKAALAKTTTAPKDTASGWGLITWARLKSGLDL